VAVYSTVVGWVLDKKPGVLGALGSVVTFLCTVTIIPFMPDGRAKWAELRSLAAR
jgi:hypothetical protein